MICLGIESTAHTFGIGIVNDKGKLLANVKDSFTTEQGGMIPVDVAEHHKKCYNNVINEALKNAKIKLEDLKGCGYLRAGHLRARRQMYKRCKCFAIWCKKTRNKGVKK